MKTLTIEIINDKATHLLEDLEAMNLIKIIEKPISKTTKTKPSDFFGTISEKEGAIILNYVNESRSEWERNI